MGTIRSEVQDQQLTKYPQEREFLNPFLNGFYVTWGTRRKAYNTEVSEYYLKPEDFMKELFGFEQEILLIYSPYDELQPRTIQAVEKIIESEPAKARVEKYNYILITDMLNPQEWINEYQLSNQERRIIIAFSKTELLQNRNDGWYIRRKLSEYLFGRDLFDYRLPLQNDIYFFGRKEIMMEYFDAARRSENRGIFGLRKTGKTSLLLKIKRQIEIDDIGKVLIYDGKNPSIRSLRWYELLKKICDDLIAEFKLQHDFKSNVITNISSDLEIIISKLQNKKIVIALDEIEYLSPISLTDKHWERDFIDFWQTIWSIQSIYRNFCFLIVGVNPYVVEMDTIENIQNPLFGIVSSRFLTGLSNDDLKIMVKTLGKKMGLNFKPDSYEYLNTRYGGHPLLTRMACSLINRHIVDSGCKKPYQIDSEYLKRNEDTRDSDLMFYCRHVVSELSQFYPDEYVMLEMLACGQISDFSELSIYPEYSRHLYSYGLIKKNKNNFPEFTIEAVKRYIGIENARKENRKTIYRLVPENERNNWLRKRKESIVKDIRQLEKAIELNKQIKLFGINSFPEADKFEKIKICDNEDDFISFINTLNRCFVESIEAYGRSLGNKQYYWNEIKNTYTGIWYALNRIKTYRVENLHLELTNKLNEELKRYLETDLENRKPSQVQELHFHLQQATIDGLLTGIQIELNRIED